MSEQELRSLLSRLQHSLKTRDYDTSLEQLSRAKLVLLALNALVPSSEAPQSALLLARETLELGALVSIRRQDYGSFTRYFSQLQPFYDLPAARLPRHASAQSKITGLYLLLLLSQGDYAGFHTVLESLEVAAEAAADHHDDGNADPMTTEDAATTPRRGMEQDVFIQYPVKLEQWLMEGSYDKVWHATKSEEVPSEEYGIFSEVLIGTIRSEIASCSEKAYPSLPITNAKNLLFLDSEGSVVDFARSRHWSLHDGRIYFFPPSHPGPSSNTTTMMTTGGGGVGAEKDILLASGQVIENTIGYARELETIV